MSPPTQRLPSMLTFQDENNQLKKEIVSCHIAPLFNAFRYAYFYLIYSPFLVWRGR